MTETIDFQQRTVVIVMKQGDIENSTVIIHRQNYDCHNEAINQGGTDDKRNNFDQIAVTYPSEGVEEYPPEAETEQYEAESEPEYEKEEDYVMGYLSWYIIRIVVILCYVLFRYMSQA